MSLTFLFLHLVFCVRLCVPVCVIVCVRAGLCECADCKHVGVVVRRGAHSQQKLSCVMSLIHLMLALTWETSQALSYSWLF